MGGGMPEGVMPPGGGPLQPAPGAPLQSVDRIRNVFPETWLWNNYTTGYFAFTVSLDAYAFLIQPLVKVN